MRCGQTTTRRVSSRQCRCTCVRDAGSLSVGRCFYASLATQRFRRSRCRRSTDKISTPSTQMIDRNGYVRRHRSGGKKTFEHREIAERALGKPLPPGVEVHHWGDRADNTKLVLCQDRLYHQLLHRRARALAAIGDPNARPCEYCGKFIRPNEPNTVWKTYPDRRWFRKPGSCLDRARHKTCAQKYLQEYRARAQQQRRSY
jgi:hypothetical protein